MVKDADWIFYKSIPEPMSGCWLWEGSLQTRGYGWAGGITAHRLSYKVHRGDIPDGLHVLHRCDQRSCVNPDHLWLGTHADNMADMSKKGRASRMVGPLKIKNRVVRSYNRGEKHSQARLTDALVREILADKRSMYALARVHGVGYQTIRHIKMRETWKHVTA